jgi:hypothetical protein
MEIFVPQFTIDLSIQRIAEMIQTMNSQEMETLCLLLSQEGKELMERKEDFDLGKVTFLTRDEVFDV